MVTDADASPVSESQEQAETSLENSEQEEARLAFYESYYKISQNLTSINKSVVKGNSKALAAVTNFPIWRPYPEKDIMDAKDLDDMFDILFDDSIRRDLKRYTAKDWETVGWRGYMLNNGRYFWADDNGRLNYITYESDKLKAYRQKLQEQELQTLDEGEQWTTTACLLAEDSSLFLRLEKRDGVERLHLFTHDELKSHKHMVFNGTMEHDGSCGNHIYWYACQDSIITVWINSPACLDGEINFGIEFPATWNLPDYLRKKTVPCQRAFWRDVKFWWE